MYETHFGLKRRPFVDSLHVDDFVELPSHQAIARRLRFGLEHGGGPVLLCGPHGSGKTLITRKLAVELGGISAHLTYTALPLPDFLIYLADELGAPSGAAGHSGAVRRIKTFLNSTNARSKRPLIVIDDAELIEDASVFEAIRQLLNFATSGPPDFSLVIAGSPEVLLRIPPGLAERLAAKAIVGHLTGPESSAYVLGRLSAAGASRNLFDDAALERLHAASEGLPRRLNRLADHALLVAYSSDDAVVGAAAVEIAAKDPPFELLAA